MSTGLTLSTSIMISPQSSGLQSSSAAAAAAAAAAAGSSGNVNYSIPNYQVQQDQVPILVSKRSATWRYLQRVHQGGMVLYNTAMLSEMDLRRGYADDKIQR
ncbi:hypothetical protein BGZ54_009252, partial [Gamsiella multidivaricata]